MNRKNFLLFMGTEASAMYPVLARLRSLGVKCGAPLQRLHKPLASRFTPEHANLWYWEAIRCIFDELGLPPIAEIPVSRISCEAREYYTRMLARCLGRHLCEDSYICADHLTAFVLPFVLDAFKYIDVSVYIYLFVSHPAYEIARRKYEIGCPAQLTEFIWRNTMLSAIRYGNEKIRIVNSECFTAGNINRLFGDVLFTINKDTEEKLSSILSDTIKIETSNISLSPYTRDVYEALCLYQRGESEWKTLHSVANDIYTAGEQFNGWQFVDCIEPSVVDGFAGYIAANAYKLFNDEEKDKLVADEKEEWIVLLENAERRLMEARQEFDAKLFINADLLYKYYSRLIEDERQMHKQKLAQTQHDLVRQHKLYVYKICSLIKFLLRNKERS